MNKRLHQEFSNRKKNSELVTQELISSTFSIERETALEAGALAYMARALIQATLPHSKNESNEFTRKNGFYTLTMIAPSDVGLPYGTIPRLLLAWITSEAVKTQNRELVLGNSLSEFMRDLDMNPTGGRWGSITRLKEQAGRLFSTVIRCNYLGANLDGHGLTRESNINFLIAEHSDLWWHAKTPNQASLFESTLTLSQSFFDEIVSKPVPIDLRTLKALRRSPLAIDIYTWLTYRNSYLRKPSNITWEQLKAQFGANYFNDAQGLRDFRKNFIKQMKKVLIEYSDAKVFQTDSGILLKPSKSHIPKAQ